MKDVVFINTVDGQKVHISLQEKIRNLIIQKQAEKEAVVFQGHFDLNEKDGQRAFYAFVLTIEQVIKTLNTPPGQARDIVWAAYQGGDTYIINKKGVYQGNCDDDSNLIAGNKINPLNYGEPLGKSSELFFSTQVTQDIVSLRSNKKCNCYQMKKVGRNAWTMKKYYVFPQLK